MAARSLPKLKNVSWFCKVPKYANSEYGISGKSALSDFEHVFGGLGCRLGIFRFIGDLEVGGNQFLAALIGSQNFN